MGLHVMVESDHSPVGSLGVVIALVGIFTNSATMSGFHEFRYGGDAAIG